MEDELETRKSKRHRSPSYPAISLREAIDRARQLFREERRSAAPVNDILRIWGYKPGSGSGLVTLAALLKFGLIEDEGTGSERRAKLTDAGFELATEDPEMFGTACAPLIEAAAMRPTIHRELWEKYEGDLPDDAALRRQLIRAGFTEQAADVFIAQFRDTLAFAGLIDSDTIDEEKDDDSVVKRHDEQRSREQEPRPFGSSFGRPFGSFGAIVDTGQKKERKSQMQTIPIPVTFVEPADWPMLQVRLPMTPDVFDELVERLKSYRGPFTKQPEPDSCDSADDASQNGDE